MAGKLFSASGASHGRVLRAGNLAAPHLDYAKEEVDVLDSQSEHLALAQTKSGCESDRDPVVAGTASCIEETQSVDHGMTLRRDVAGRVTELTLHGFLAVPHRRSRFGPMIFSMIALDSRPIRPHLVHDAGEYGTDERRGAGRQTQHQGAPVLVVDPMDHARHSHGRRI